MASTYESDIIAWANEQARLIRAGHFDLLDIEHIAEEIEDVGRSEQRELASRMAVLLSHLLKWKFQPLLRSSSWERTLREQRKRIIIALNKTPSLKTTLDDSDWLEDMWLDALSQARKETGMDSFPEQCPWGVFDEVLNAEWLPS
jgi:hypothetical protein